jgi:hypothetical protein
MAACRCSVWECSEMPRSDVPHSRGMRSAPAIFSLCWQKNGRLQNGDALTLVI